ACSADVAVTDSVCPHCGTSLPLASSPTLDGGSPDDQGTTAVPGGLMGSHAAASSDSADRLQAGQAFGHRYHIIKLLGVGGMGAVYQAWDDELGVAVAIKTIRPGAGADPTSAHDAERRFKRELVLARQ